MALAIENAATATFSGTNSGTISMSTGGTNRIVVLQVHCEKNAARQTVSTVSGGGLTWARRKAFAFNASNTSLQNLEVWWAYAAAQQTAVTVTVTLSAATDDASMIICAVSGVESSAWAAPWDVNASLPATNSDISGANSTASVTGVSTDAENALLFGFWGAGATASSMPTQGSGYTEINHVSNGGGTNFSLCFSERKLVAAAQSNVTVPTAVATQKNWGMIADAIRQAGLATVNAVAAQTVPVFTQSLTGQVDVGAVASQTINAFENTVRASLPNFVARGVREKLPLGILSAGGGRVRRPG